MHYIPEFTILRFVILRFECIQYLLHLEQNFLHQQLQQLPVHQDLSLACLGQRLELRLAHNLILGQLVHIWGPQGCNWGQLGHNLPFVRGQTEVLLVVVVVVHICGEFQGYNLPSVKEQVVVLVVVHICWGFEEHNFLVHCIVISGSLGLVEVPGHIGKDRLRQLP